MNKRIYSRILLIGILVTTLSLTACSNTEESEGNGSGTTEIATEDNTMQQSSPVEDNTIEEPIENKKGVNPLNFSSVAYEKCETDKFLDKDKTVKYLASVAYEKKEENEKQCAALKILHYDGSQILVEYMYASDKELSGTGPIETHLELYDKETGTLIKKLYFIADSVYVEKRSETIYVEILEKDTWSKHTYDFKLNEVVKFTSNECEADGVVTNDGKRLYYVKNGKLYLYDSGTKMSKEQKSKDKYIAEYIEFVVTDESGNDYIAFNGMAADYNTYLLWYDVTNAVIVRAEVLSAFYEGYGDFVLETQWSVDDELGHQKWIVGSSNSSVHIYEYTDKVEKNIENVFLQATKKGDLVFNAGKGEDVYIDVYDKDTGEIKASVSFNVADIRRKPINGQLEEHNDYDYMGVYDEPLYISDNVMLLALTDFYGTKYYVEWTMKGSGDSKIIKSSDYKIGIENTVDISEFEGVLLTPGELSEKLKPLNVVAVRIENEYDIDIKIGEECSDISGGYLIYPLTNYKTIEKALRVLEEELKKYPDNFFSQFKYNGLEGIEINISSDLVGITEDGLDTAAGVTCIANDRIKIAMDSDSDSLYSFGSTLHHELSHAIDNLIDKKQMYEENPVFSEEKWNEFNPYEDMYTNSYAEFGKEKYWDDYLYYNIIYSPEYDGGEIGAYFIDGYGMTYPTEDRARIFENVMCDEDDIDFSKSPYLKAKLNYFAECIRATFDTTGWGEVPWEAYME